MPVAPLRLCSCRGGRHCTCLRVDGQAPHPLRRLAVVALAANLPALLPREELLQVGARDLFEREVKLRADLRQIPQYVAQLALQRRSVLLANLPALVAEDL